MNLRLSRSTLATRPLAVLLGCTLLAGCGGGVVIGAIDEFSCDPQIAELTGSLGFPERVDEGVRAGLVIQTFWYFKSGLGITFTSGAGFPCRREDVTFAPVR